MGYDDPSAADSAAILLLVVLSIVAYFAFFVAIYVVVAWFLSRVFAKAGLEKWKAWVPFYNGWVLLELGGQAGWWVFVAFLPFVGIVSSVFMAIAGYNIGLRLQKTGVFVVLYILLPPVWLGMLAFDSSRWNPHPLQGIFVPPEWALPTTQSLRYVPQAPASQQPPFQPPQYQQPPQGGPSV